MATTTTVRRKTFFFEDSNHIQTCKRPDLMRAQEEGRLARKQFNLRPAYRTIQAGEGTHDLIIDLETDLFCGRAVRDMARLTNLPAMFWILPTFRADHSE